MTLALLGALAPPAACARNMALVVGVSKYPSLNEERWLPGARNDAVSVARFLRSRGFADRDVIVLAETTKRGQQGIADLPTRGAILHALADLTAQAAPGDFVYIHFSGHGSRQPSRGPAAAGGAPKPDGLDTTFLPRDVGRWDAELQTVTNAIVDDEFLDAVTRIRNRGAFVWAVFDSCHSEGVVVRGVRERMRGIGTRQLGIPAAALERARALADQRLDAQPPRAPLDARLLPDPRIPLAAHAGEAVVFSASLARETTPEGVYGEGAGAEEHGLFTFVLLRLLARSADLTYGELLDKVQDSYAAMNRESPNPVIHGDAQALAFGQRGRR